MKYLINFFRYIVFIIICILSIEIIFVWFIFIIEYIFFHLSPIELILVLFFLFWFIRWLYNLIAFFLILWISYIAPNKKIWWLIFSTFTWIYWLKYLYDTCLLDVSILIKIIILWILLSFTIWMAVTPHIVNEE